jgi:hypothetical protein
MPSRLRRLQATFAADRWVTVLHSQRRHDFREGIWRIDPRLLCRCGGAKPRRRDRPRDYIEARIRGIVSDDRETIATLSLADVALSRDEALQLIQDAGGLDVRASAVRLRALSATGALELFGNCRGPSSRVERSGATNAACVVPAGNKSIVMDGDIRPALAVVRKSRIATYRKLRHFDRLSAYSGQLPWDFSL